MKMCTLVVYPGPLSFPELCLFGLATLLAVYASLYVVRSICADVERVGWVHQVFPEL